MVAKVAENIEELEEFFNFFYQGLEGYVYIATKAVDNNSQFNQNFFQWPTEKSKLKAFCLEKAKIYEVYFAPAIFKEPSAKKEAVLGARVLWSEFDGSLPKELGTIPEPTLRIQSSEPGHEHWYWKLDGVISPYDLEGANRSITYALGADVSGWDANQILRPVGTKNHKRNREVTLRNYTAVVYPDNAFSSLPEPPPVGEIPIPEHLPPIEDIISDYKFPPKVWQLFKKGMPEGKRSEGLMSLGYYLAEMQMQDEEVFAMLLNADERWGKYHGRQDQYKRLMELVVRARNKYPLDTDVSDDISFIPMGFNSILTSKLTLEWVWKGLLQKGGYFLLTGPSGVGKTQFSLDAAMHMAMGEEFLGRSMTGEHKIGFFSLEMGQVDLKSFLELQAKGLSSEELSKLEERLKFYPLGEPLYLTVESIQEQVEEAIKEHGFTGLIFDSLGSVTTESLSSEENVKKLMDWNDKLRKRLGVFTWFIHHHRKATGDNRKPNKLSDVYGSQYITARTTTTLALWDTGIPATLSAIPLKVRLTEQPPAFHIYRDGRLRFSEKQSWIKIKEKIGPAEMEKPVSEVDEKIQQDKTSSPGKGKMGF